MSENRSNDFTKILVTDDRIGQCTDELKVGVFKSGQHMTVYKCPAVSSSTSSINFNVQIPSQNTIMSRKVRFEAEFELSITGKSVVDESFVKYGTHEGLAAYPGHALFTNMNLSINSTNCSVNMNNVLPILANYLDPVEMARSTESPVQRDQYYKYSDSINKINCPFGGLQNSANNSDLVPRGAFPLVSITGNRKWKTTDPDGVSVGTHWATTDDRDVRVKFRVSEYLMISPFIYGEPENTAGLYGIQAMSILLNLDSDAKRCWRTNEDATKVSPRRIQLVGVKDCALFFDLLTPQPSQLMPKRNVVPYYSMDRYITGNFGVIANGATPTISTSTISMSSIPDKVFVVVRKPISALDNKTPDVALPITGVSISFNNQSGILSSANQRDLYAISKKAGNKQTWDEFRGSTSAGIASVSGAHQTYLTTGSYFCFQMGRDCNISQDYYAPMSIGQFLLQINVAVDNSTGADFTPEILVVCQSSGVFVTEAGVSNTHLNILDKQSVLDSSSTEGVTESHLKRMVGGGWLDSLKSIGSIAGPIMRSIPFAPVQAVGNMMGSVGMGRSGGKLASRLV